MRSVGVAFTCVLTSLASAAAAEDSTQRGAAGTATATGNAPAPPKPTATGNTPAAKAAPAAAPTPAPAAAPPPPDTNAPPLYYVEPPESAQPEVYEPPEPTYMYEPPPPPPEVSRNAPASTALWAGVRLGALIPFGSLWVDGFNGYYRQRQFADYASTGPVVELDVGARLALHYNVFALWEHTSLGTGSLDSAAFGGQERGATNLYGIGVRFSTNPTSTGFLAEIGLGYRDFHAYWSDGTELSLTGGWFDARIGFGVDIRISPWLSLSPMVVLAGGSFDSAKWSGPGGSRNALTAYDDGAQYGTVSFVLGAHADVF
jgi:hypothetical protein